METLGVHLGYGDGRETPWTSAQQQHLRRLILYGYRQFLYPPPIDGGGPHVWSFLRRRGTLTLQPAVREYLLPEDFGVLLGPFSYGEQPPYQNVPVVGRARAESDYTNTTGRPRCAVLLPVEHHGVESGRTAAAFYPLPDAALTLYFDYDVNPLPLDEEHPEPICPVEHSSTLVESVLAAAEAYLDDTQGVHSAAFRERLAASILRDRAAARPQEIGLLNDPGTEPQWGRAGKLIYVTYGNYPEI